MISNASCIAGNWVQADRRYEAKGVQHSINGGMRLVNGMDYGGGIEQGSKYKNGRMRTSPFGGGENHTLVAMVTSVSPDQDTVLNTKSWLIL